MSTANRRLRHGAATSASSPARGIAIDVLASRRRRQRSTARFDASFTRACAASGRRDYAPFALERQPSCATTSKGTLAPRRHREDLGRRRHALIIESSAASGSPGPTVHHEERHATACCSLEELAEPQGLVVDANAERCSCRRPCSTSCARRRDATRRCAAEPSRRRADDRLAQDPHCSDGQLAVTP